MTGVVDLVLEYVARSQRARLEQTPEAWDAVAELLDEHVETRLAGGSDGSVWQTYRGRSERIARLSRSDVEASRLETENVRAFGSDELGLVTVEQLSTRREANGTAATSPGCFIFDVVDGRITRISIYRNLA